MKSKKLVGLLALASCVMLGACGEKKPDPTPEPEPTPVVPEISVAELPSVLFTGDSLDLEEYVTVRNASSYSVSLSEASKAIADLDGKKITATGEGEVKFTITAGTATKECAVNAESEVRYILSQQFKDVGNNYTAYELHYDESEGQVYRTNAYYHNPGYVMQAQAYLAKDTYGPFGFVELGDGELYQCYSMDDEPTELTIDPYVYPSNLYRIMDAYNPELPFDFEKASLFYDEDYEEYGLSITGEDAVAFAEGALMMDGGNYYPYHDSTYTTYDVYQIDEVLCYLQNDAEEGEDPAYVAYMELLGSCVWEEIPADQDPDEGGGHAPTSTEQSYYYYSYMVSNQEDDLGFELADDIVGKPEARPAGVDYLNLSGALSNVYNMIYSYGSASISYSAGWCDDSGNPIEKPDDLGIFDIFPEVAASKYISSNGYVEIDTEGNIASGMVKKDDKVYDVEGTVSDLRGYENSDFEDPLNNYEATLVSLLMPGTVENNAVYNFDIVKQYPYCTECSAYVDASTVSTSTESSTGYVHNDDTEAGLVHTEGGEVAFVNAYVFSLNLRRQNSILKAFFNSDPQLKQLADTLDLYAEQGLDLWDYFIGSTIYYNQRTAVVQLSTSFTWDDGQNYAINIAFGYGAETAKNNVNYVITNLVTE